MESLKPVYYNLETEIQKHSEILRLNAVERARASLISAVMKELKHGQDITDEDALLNWVNNKGVVKIYDKTTSQRQRTPKTIKDLREQMGLSQSQFAKEFGFNIRTLQEWEYGRTKTPDYVISLLTRVVH